MYEKPSFAVPQHAMMLAANNQWNNLKGRSHTNRRSIDFIGSIFRQVNVELTLPGLWYRHK